MADAAAVVAAEKAAQAAQRAARQAKKEARRQQRGGGQQQRRARVAAAAAEAPLGAYLYCSCVGQLGSFGNHVFQFAYARALADVHGLKLVSPAWLGQRVFVGGGADCSPSAATVGVRGSRLLLADKMVVGHAEWREWACACEPLRGICEAEGAEAVTGRRAKREIPQVNGASIAPSSASLLADGRLHESAAGAAVVELAGAMQFAPRVFGGHRERLREVLALRPAMQALVQQILAELRDGVSDPCIVAVHLGSSYKHGGSSSAAESVDWWRKAGSEPASVADGEPWPYRTAHEWCDERMTWDAPEDWIVEWLDTSWERLSVERHPVLLLCAGAASAESLAALPAGLRRYSPRTVQQIMGETDGPMWTAAREAVADTLTDEALLTVVEWAVQTAADVLAISNSTQSFSAAWVSADVETDDDDMLFPRLWRADRTAGKYVTFDPWCTDTMIEAAEERVPTERSRPLASEERQLSTAKDQKRRDAGDIAWREATDLMHSLYLPAVTAEPEAEAADSTESAVAPKSSVLEATLHALTIPPLDTTIRLNSLKTDRKSLIKQLQEAGVPALESAPLYDAVPDLIIVPGTGPHKITLDHPVICLDRRCGEAVMTGADVFAPGVKAVAPGIAKGDLVSVIVDIDGVTLKGQPPPPQWLASHRDQDGAGGARNGRWRHVGNGIAMMDRIDMITAGTRGTAVQIQSAEYSRPAMHGILDNLLMVQSLPSLLVSHILAPQPGERVLDMCASPGGKTTHLATLMANTGLLVALDRTQSKINDINELAERLGVGPGGCIQAQPMDCRKLMDPAATEPVRLPDGRMRYPPEYFDRILLDPSCSALGLRPRLLHTASAADLAGYAKLQRLLLRWAVKLLKPEGTLVFSTCTMNPLENEHNVLFCLENFPLELQPQAPFHIGDPGLAIPRLSPESCALVQRFEPGSPRVDAMGFFCAKFRKTAHYEDDFA